MQSTSRKALVLVLSALLALAAAVTAVPASAGEPTWEPGPARYGVLAVQNVPIVMDDGVTLVGDVDYPADLATGGAATGRFPVLLEQNPYGCQVPSIADHSLFVSRGYIHATVCVRGTGRSGGVFSFIGPREQRDGVALVDWAAHRLRGSNGVVGLFGNSFEGLTQWITAGALPADSGVKAMAPTNAGASLYRESTTSGGVPTETVQYISPGIAGLMGPRAGVWGASTAAQILSGGDAAYDGSLFGQRTPGDYAAKIVQNRIPALLWTGWEDIFDRTSQEMYAYLQNAAAGRPTYGPMPVRAPASPRYQIVVGPYGHGTGIDSTVLLQWYDTWLKDMDTPLRHTRAPMHLWQLGARPGWTGAKSFPMTNRYTRFYLGSGGTLSTAAPRTRGADTLDYAPAAVSSLTYTTPAFADGATLAGPISATVTASSTGTNMNVIASVYDLAPDGTSTYITQGNLAGSFAAYDESRTWRDVNGVDINPYPRYDYDRWLTPGKPVELHITISPKLYALAAGHKLQVVMTSQEQGRCTALLGWRPCFPTAPQLRTFPGTYSLLRGTEQQSSINLPLLPAGTFAPVGTTVGQPTGF